MNVLILEIDHEIQRVDALRSAAMKADYRRLLEQLIAENEVQFVGEEAHPRCETVAKQVSDALRLPFPWRTLTRPRR